MEWVEGAKEEGLLAGNSNAIVFAQITYLDIDWHITVHDPLVSTAKSSSTEKTSSSPPIDHGMLTTDPSSRRGLRVSSLNWGFGEIAI